MLFYALPHRFRWMMLLAASYYFYMCWKPEYIILIIVSTLIDYSVAINIARSQRPSARKALLMLSIFSNLGILFGFRYFNFFSESTRDVLSHFNIMADIPYFDVLLPVGISFYTFQTLSYTIDVFRKKQEPERHIGYFALYVSYFPQLVAGPIERPGNLLPQLRQPVTASGNHFTEGLRLILFGFFKKLVIADRMAEMVNVVYNNPGGHYGFSVVAATVFFAFQIYGDFSGYTDIARGSARIMGYNLMVNFRLPYFSKNVKEFWQRWHISLSTWFRDYLYISMGGNRKGKNRQNFNTFIVFVVSGLWHGANWTFVIWGALHGIYVTAGSMMAGIRKKVNQTLGWQENNFIRKIYDIGLTFILVNFAWIFFRANNTGDAFILIGNIFRSNGHWFTATFVQTWNSFTVSLVMLSLLIIIQLLIRKSDFQQWTGKQPAILRYSLYMILLWSVLLFGNFGNHQFIYFQF
jgi:D-alanyl-lipoteichoic acid acyltransferase DltB (MBOAT superfamily)